MFDYDYEGVEESEGGRFAPEGVYFLRVKETKEARIKTGDHTGRPLVKCKIEIAEGPHKGIWCFFNVSFLPKKAAGAGISKSFLKAIGQPHKGQVEVKPTEWGENKFIGKFSLVKNDKYWNNDLGLDFWRLDDPSAPELGIIGKMPEKEAKGNPSVAGSQAKQQTDLEEVPF